MIIRATDPVDCPSVSPFAAEGCDGDAKTPGNGDQFIVSNNDCAVLDAGNGGLIELHPSFGDTSGQVSLRHRRVVRETGFANPTACQVFN